MIDLRIEADQFLNDCHAIMQIDMENRCFRNSTLSSSWETIVTHLPEVRKDGILANVEYDEVYSGPKDSRFLAVMHLALYRSHIFLRMMQSCKFNESVDLSSQIERHYSLHLAWHMRLRDKFDAICDEKVEHLWLN